MRINQYFGTNGQWYRNNGIDILGHNGIDFWAPDGHPVKAAHDGVVDFVGRDSKEGLGITIRTKYDKENKSGYKTIYWHLKDGRTFVEAGEEVKAGQVIAEADNTGFSTGSHLHFGLKRITFLTRGDYYNTDQENGYYGAIDPMPYFAKTAKEMAIMAIQREILRISSLILELYRKLIAARLQGK